MHTQVRLFIKTAVMFLVIGLTIGVTIMVRRELLGIWPDPRLVSAHTHAVLIGFVMFLILGVALWLFPRPSQDDPRYSPARITICYWLLASSTLSRVATETARSRVDSVFLSWVVVITSVGQAVGLLFYFFTMWNRIRPLGSQQREARGERF